MKLRGTVTTGQKRCKRLRRQTQNQCQGIDEFRIILGGQPTQCFFCNRIREKQFFTLPVVNDNKIVRITSDGVEMLEGKSGSVCYI